MDILAQTARLKQNRFIIAIVAIGSVLTFVASFGTNLKEICAWTSICEPDAAPSAIAFVGTGRARAFLENATLLGPAKYPSATSINARLDAEFELESDERELWGDMTDAGEAGKFPDAAAYYSSLYEYATYTKGSLNYIIRYRKQGQEASAILLEAVAGADTCVDDLRQLPDLTAAFAYGRPVCIGKTTFGDIFASKSAAIKSPFGSQSSPASCRGQISTGGAGGSGAGIEVTCKRSKRHQSDVDLSYLLRFVSVGGEYDANIEFDDENLDPEAHKAFWNAAKSVPITSVILFDPRRIN